MNPPHDRRVLHPAAILLALAASGCAGEAAQTSESACTISAVNSLPDQLHEASGVASSRTHAGLVWTHNDSGGDPIVYGVDSSGAVAAELHLRNARNVDWEDIAVDDCPGGGGNCIYVADIGDNRAERDDIGVYVTPEPASLGPSVAEARFVSLRYAAGPRDAEAMFLTDAHRLVVISKGRSHPVAVFMTQPVAAVENRTLVLQEVQPLSDAPVELPRQVTGAARRNQLVLVRSYSGLQPYRLDGEGLRRDGRAVDLQPLGEPQGEGVAIMPDGSLVLSSEEGPQSVAARLTRLTCAFDE